MNNPICITTGELAARMDHLQEGADTIRIDILLTGVTICQPCGRKYLLLKLFLSARYSAKKTGIVTLATLLDFN